MSPLPRGVAVRRDAGLYGYERALARAGFVPVAGADEAGRGACAGPLVVAAVILPEGRRGQVPGLADSKLLTPAVRECVYAEVVDRALAWHAVVIPPAEIDTAGLHVSNVAGMRRALARLSLTPSYVLTDGFRVAGLCVPGLAVWKGDQVAACIAAASVVAKVTRDRIMTELHEHFPMYDFATHKGYVTPVHQEALERHGPCSEHRFSYVNVARARDGLSVRKNDLLTDPALVEVAGPDFPRDGEVGPGERGAEVEFIQGCSTLRQVEPPPDGRPAERTGVATR